MSEIQHIIIAKSLKSAQQLALNINQSGKEFAILNKKSSYTKILTSTGKLQPNTNPKYYLFDIKKQKIKNWNDESKAHVMKQRKIHNIKNSNERGRLNTATLEDLYFVGNNITKIFKNLNVEIESIRFVGSKIKGYAKEDSDLDVLVIVKDKNLWNNGIEYTNFVNSISNNSIKQRNGHKVDLMIHKYHEKDPFTYQSGQKYITFTKVLNKLNKR